MKVTGGDIGSTPGPVTPPPGGHTGAPRAVRFEAKDGHPLAGRMFSAAAPRGGVLLAGATGVPARFYRSFASWLAEEQGLNCLTFDYRGIGGSLQGPLSQSEARLQDWGELDLPAALDLLGENSCGPLSLIGHSAGGQLLGLMPNVHRIERIVQVACSSGYFGQLSPKLRLTARLLMQVYLPLSTRVVGYAACKAVGWGEDLPAQVARQWADWCARPGYVENAFGTTVEAHAYDEIRAPILNLSFTDDTIATEANVEDLLRLFPAAPVERRRLTPEDVQGRSIGHIGFFRRSQIDLWPMVADFLTAT